jgi:multiple sugar transport system substrate-binding protein
VPDKGGTATTGPGADSSRLVKAPFYEDVPGIPNIEAPQGFDWKSFSGTTLNFLVENNIYANILTRECEQFTKITGITVNIRPMDFNTMIEKINLDFISKTGKYQIVYADLNRFEKDPSLPHLPGGLEDFFSSQVDVDSYFLHRDRLLAIPFDSTTMILYYRKDIFEKYKTRFMADKGYDWTPGRRGFTWERYSEIAQWITQNVTKSEVKYGSGHMAKKHNSLFCDFSSVLSAYGGDYFKDRNVGGLGLQKAGELGVMDDKFIRALEVYKKVINTATPESILWDWYDTSEAFKAGDIAMMPNWDENFTSIENEDKSKVAGKVGYSILPYGSERSANIFGGTGVGINRDCTEKEKLAAWLFILWATSPHTENIVLKHPEGGVIPSRKSVYEDNDIKSAIARETAGLALNGTMLTLPTVLKTWNNENCYYRPKVGNFYSVEEIVVNQLHRMLKDNVDARTIAGKMGEQISALK